MNTVLAGAEMISTDAALVRRDVMPPRKSALPYSAAATSANAITTGGPLPVQAARSGGPGGRNTVIFSSIYRPNAPGSEWLSVAASDLARALARTLQSLRAERGWSLDQLAARSGVSKGVLVALEQARSNPNLATLARLSDAFGVPVTYLVDVSAEPSVRLTGPDQARTLWHGPAGGTGTIIAATEAPWAAELWRWVLMPGESFGGDAHAAATRELAWVEEGTLTLTVARAAPGRAGPVRALPRRPAARVRERGLAPRAADDDRRRPARAGLTARAKR